MVQTPPQSQQLPWLESGDRLTRDEFERRYAAMPELKKAELIEGVVYVPAALRFKSHAKPHGNLMGWLWIYSVFTPQVELGDNPTIRLDLDNEPQPDAVLMIAPTAGGQARLSPDDYIEGAPELAVEVAASSTAIDMHDKKHAYRRNGVQEYLVWQVFERRIVWFELSGGEYVSLPTDESGVIRSRAFPGLWLDTAAMLANENETVLNCLREGLTSPDHQAFVSQLSV
ncbi:MAG: Uma2 family endonuclease [Cyanobacteria bacterium J06554_6]